MSACTVPDVSTEAKLLDASVAVSEKKDVPSVVAAANQERDEAKKSAISNSFQIYRAPTACSKLGSVGVSDTAFAACKLDAVFPVPDEPSTAVFREATWEVIRSYADAVNALARDESAKKIGENLSALLAASNGLKHSIDEDSDVLAIAESDIKTAASLATRLTESARARALKRLVDDAHDPLETMIDHLIIHDRKTSGLKEAARELTKASQALDEARPSPTPRPVTPAEFRAYSQAVTDYEKAFKTFRTIFDQSETKRLMTIWKAHQALRAALGTDQNIEATLGVLEDLKSLTE
ncbi:hypothetical protein [uncultured Tateyamaria sp.]|uniref:hypothetical protein n=1 Tax=uncultured Tateyamaria sp. TaxID=455651 RepID=UPI002611FDAD|nr:hypothetical protein [uncultured Tateyamaria sp.]